MTSQFVLSVWGEKHLDLFCRAVLPSLMTPGNLLGFNGKTSEFDIYTTAASRASLIAMPIISALQAVMPVRITIISKSAHQASDKYVDMNDGHAQATVRSGEIDSAIYFLAPDAVFADGTLAFARELIDKGRRVVLLAAPRVAGIPFLNEAIATFNPLNLFQMKIPPRALVNLFLRYPHDCQQYLLWGNQPYTLHPSHLLFPIANEGYIVRGFHHHPLAVYPKVRAAIPKATLDGRWLIDAVPDLQEWSLITDTDDGCAFDIGTAVADHNGAKVERDPMTFVAGWMTDNADAGHRWNITRSVTFHQGQRSSRWDKEELRVEQLVATLFNVERKRKLRFRTRLYQAANMAPTETIIIWGAGMAAKSVAGNLDLETVECFIDSDPEKQGTTCLGLPVRAPEVLLDQEQRVILIGSVNFDAAIRQQLKRDFSRNVKCILSVSDLLKAL